MRAVVETLNPWSVVLTRVDRDDVEESVVEAAVEIALDVLAEASEAAAVTAFAIAAVSELKVELLLETTRLETAVESSSVRERTFPSIMP